MNRDGPPARDPLVSALHRLSSSTPGIPTTRRFRGFASFDRRRWVEEVGSEDSHGRALWALGACSNDAANLSRRRWAAETVRRGARRASETRSSSPRAWACTLLGLGRLPCAAVVDDAAAVRMRGLLADRLISRLVAAETSDWVWFEEALAYDNARLPQALILSGLSTGADPVQIALPASRSLDLATALVADRSHRVTFAQWGRRASATVASFPGAFDQQPLEPAATVSACLAAWRADGDPRWKVEAARAFAWFLGDNDLASPLVDVDTGSCRDGLHPDRANENCGQQITVST